MGECWYTEFVSGWQRTRRDAFEQVLLDARLDNFDVLLVDHTSRFGRNQADCIKYKTELKRLGKIVVFVSQGIISGSEKDFLAERINETLDEAYSRNLSRYVRSGLAEKFSGGYAIGRAPLGYRTAKAPSGRGARAVPDEQTMRILIDLLESYATGDHSFKTLAESLNAKDYLTNDGRPFTESSISTMLNNRFYEGKAVYHRNKPDEQVIDGAHKVPEEVKRLWLRCQEVRQERSKAGQPSPRSREHRVYPLTGVLVCDGCRAPFHGVMNHSDQGVRSRRMAHSWHRCGLRPLSVGAERVEQEFTEKVLSHIELDQGWREAVEQLLANEGPQPDNAAELGRVETAQAKLRKQRLWGVLDDADFRTQYESLGRQRRALQPRVAPAATPNLDRAAELLKDLPILWQHPGVSMEQRRELAREVFEEVRLREGQLVAVKPHEQYGPIFAYGVYRSVADVGDARSS